MFLSRVWEWFLQSIQREYNFGSFCRWGLPGNCRTRVQNRVGDDCCRMLDYLTQVARDRVDMCSLRDTKNAQANPDKSSLVNIVFEGATLSKI